MNLSSALVSIIVPVFNAAKTLAPCVESILGQSYRNLQVLLVDNGSTDNSLALCRQYAARDRRVSVATQPEPGVALARNTALALAQGEYLQFVDSDDRLSPHATAHMVRLSQVTGCDLAVGRYYLVLGREASVHGLLNRNAVYTCDDFILAMRGTPCSYYFSVLWNKLYRTRIIREHGLAFDPDLVWGEDFAFNAQYLQYAARIAVTDGAYYYYIKNIKGLTVRSSLHLGINIRVKVRMYGYYNRLLKARGLNRACWDRLLRFFGNMPLYD